MTSDKASSAGSQPGWWTVATHPLTVGLGIWLFLPLGLMLLLLNPRLRSNRRWWAAAGAWAGVLMLVGWMSPKDREEQAADDLRPAGSSQLQTVTPAAVPVTEYIDLQRFIGTYNLPGRSSSRPIRIFITSTPSPHISQITLTDKRLLKPNAAMIRDCVLLKQLTCREPGITGRWDTASSSWNIQLETALSSCHSLEVLDTPAVGFSPAAFDQVCKQLPNCTAIRCFIKSGGMDTIPLAAICKSVSRLNKLKALSLSLGWKYEKCEMAAILSACSNLEYLEIDGARVEDILAIAKKLPKVRTVVLPSFSWGMLMGFDDGPPSHEAAMPWIEKHREQPLIAGLKPLGHVRTVVLSTTVRGSRSQYWDPDAFATAMKDKFPHLDFVVEAVYTGATRSGDVKEVSIWRQHVPEVYPGQQEVVWGR